VVFGTGGEAGQLNPATFSLSRKASRGGTLNKTKQDDFLATITTKNSTRIFDKRSSHGCEK
jgi:hypothetical protein